MKLKAKRFATAAHYGQVRKSEPEKPMIIHPIAVAKILEKYGYDDNVVSAGYLHDVIEDTKYTFNDIYTIFGKDIANLVLSASEPDKSLSWEERKALTIKNIKTIPLRNKAVICADKIHNLESLTRLLNQKGKNVFECFKRDHNSQLWYFENVYKSLIYNEDKDNPLFKRLEIAIENFKNEILKNDVKDGGKVLK